MNLVEPITEFSVDILAIAIVGIAHRESLAMIHTLAATSMLLVGCPLPPT